jgi:hypothetical protein
MSRSRRFVVALGFLAVLLPVAMVPTALAGGGKEDSPEAKLRARIADLHAEVTVLEVECAASRHNLLESLKTLGKLELGDRNQALSKAREKMNQLMMEVKAAGSIDPKGLKEVLEKLPSSLAIRKQVIDRMQPGSVKDTNKDLVEQAKLVADLAKGGSDAEKALDRLAELEFQARLDSARAETGRMKADFLKKCRLLYQKKLELADAEAEYKATK